MSDLTPEAWEQVLKELGQMLRSAGEGMMPSDEECRAIAEKMLDAAIEKERARLGKAQG